MQYSLHLPAHLPTCHAAILIDWVMHVLGLASLDVKGILAVPSKHV